MPTRVPINGSPFGTISRSEHEFVWRGYAGDYGTQQSAELIAERGGFSLAEVVTYRGGTLPSTWEADARTPKPRRPRLAASPEAPHE